MKEDIKKKNIDSWFEHKTVSFKQKGHQFILYSLSVLVVEGVYRGNTTSNSSELSWLVYLL
jgi:hypothetical protein